MEPSAKSQAEMRDKVRAVLEVRTRNQPVVAVIRKVNHVTRGWANAFHYGNSTRVFGKQQRFVRNRLRRWLWRKHGCTHGVQLKVMSPPESFSFSFSYSFSFLFILYLYLSPRPFLTKEKEKEKE